MRNKKINEIVMVFAVLSLSILMTFGTAIMTPMIGAIQISFVGTSPLFLKFLVSVSFIPQLFVTMLIGTKWGINWDRKKIVLIALFSYLISGVIGYIAKGLVMLVISRLLTGMSVGVFSTMGPLMIGNRFQGHLKERMMGYNVACLNVGNMIGALLSGYLVMVRWNNPFLLYSLGLLTMIAFSFFPSAPKSNTSCVRARPKLTSQHIRIFIFVLMMAILIGGITTGMALYISQKGMGQSDLVGVVMALSALCSFITSINLSRIRKQLRDWLLSASLVMSAVGFMLIFISESSALLIIGCSIVYSALGMWLPEVMLNASNMQGKESQTLAVVLINMGYAGGMISSPFFFKLLTTVMNVGIVGAEFLLASLICLGVFLGHSSLIVVDSYLQNE